MTKALLLVAVTCWMLAIVSLLHGTQGIYEDHRNMIAVSSGRLNLIAPRALARVSLLVQAQRPIREIRAVNVGLALIVSALVVLIGRALGVSGWISGAVMAVHPLTVETIAALSGRFELMAAIGVLSACLFALRGWWIVVILSVGFGIMGKESAGMAIALVPLALLARRWSWFALSACMVGIGVIVAQSYQWQFSLLMAHDHDMVMSSWEWFTLQSTATMRLLALSVIPWHQTLDYDYDALSTSFRLACVAGLAAVSMGALAFWRSNRIAACGLMWALLVSLPRLIVHTPRSYFNEHQWYLALVGVAIAFDALLSPRLEPA